MSAKASKTILDIQIGTSEVKIIDPTTRGHMGLTIELRPMSDPAVQKVQEGYTRKVRDGILRRQDTSELEKEQVVEVLVAAIVGWRWENATFGGSVALDPLEFTPENVRAVLRSRTLSFIRLQIDQKLSEEGDFLEI